MGIIKKLDPILIDRIAAGEVIERPASVIKELVENSIDANSKKIEISTLEGGIKKIIVSDNGDGILKEDLPLAIEKHATSKINKIQDIESIYSFGFRGEALSSIASISYLEIQTRHKDESQGNQLISRGGKLISIKPYPCLKGTKVIVEDLFFSTPARKKYLKNNSIEDRYNLKEIIKLSLSHSEIEFLYFRDEKKFFHLYPVRFEDLPERTNLLFQNNFSELLLPLYFSKNQIIIKGWIGKPRIERNLTDKQFVFFNNRPVEIKNLSYIIKNAYGELIPDKSSPIFFLFYELPANRIDVNVHPTKKEIRIFDESEIYEYTIKAIRKTLVPNFPLKISEKELLPKEIKQNTNTSSIFFPIEEVIYKSEIKPFEVKEKLESYEILNTTEKEIKSSFLPLRHFGVIFGTYILACNEDEFYFIDQHTANERINYEKIKEKILQQGISNQYLLTPIILNFSLEEIDQIDIHKETIKKQGFEIEIISKNSIVIKEVPFYIEEGTEEKIFIALLNKIIKGIQNIKLYEEYAAMKACKSSFKKNDYIPSEKISEMLIELSKCKEPSRCPHGRPTMLTISRSKLDYLFFRTGFKK